ncbi:hypothetical protein HHL17_29245 [Chitinophaga sp. G-6-1-13]|uniref:Lipoprotein n=1 Tax=Chitinophaga fulva TaxID=2728842 RepID=A0A848GRS5_9BACT|nr:hypothetical protein [Chitinophaga fulva]NML41315.1 hypothetical protein [Chitinophaga fulva]
MKIMLMLITALTLCSCATTLTSSRFTSAELKPGIGKQAVIARFGKPFKKSFTKIGEVLYEDFYYKETIYKDYWFEINNILHFEDGKLVSLEQGEEKRLYQSPVIMERKVII